MRTFKLVLLVIVVVLLGAGLYAAFGNYSDGERAGTISKITRKGVLFKTWEGQLNLGGFGTDNSGSPASSLWEFSVSDAEIVKQLQEANLTGRRVRLHYNEKFFRFFWQSDTKYHVDKVDVAPAPVYYPPTAPAPNSTTPGAATPASPSPAPAPASK